MLRHSHWALVVLLLGCLRVSAQPAVALEEEEILRRAGVEPTSKSILAFLQTNIPSPETQAQISKYVDWLGHRAFKMRETGARELIKIGAPALNPLQAVLRHPDAEVVRRAQNCIGEIEKNTHPEVIAAALRVLRARPIPGALPILLDYFPHVSGDWNTSDIQDAIRQLGIDASSGKADAALIAALKSKHPLSRALSAELLVRHGDQAARALARPLLQDGDASVVLPLAIALIDRQDREAIPVLIRLLPSLPASQRLRAQEIIPQLLGADTPSLVPPSEDENWKQFSQACAEWWSKNEASYQIRNCDLSRQLLGRLLIAQLNGDRQLVQGKVAQQGRVYERDRQGKILWKIDNLLFPIDARMLAPDRVLICEYHGEQVTERNLKGDILWRKQFTERPTNALRLQNGHTLVNLLTRVVEVDRQGREVRTFKPVGRDGRERLYLGMGQSLRGQLITIDRLGEVTFHDSHANPLRKFSTGRQSSGYLGLQSDVLPNGHLLLADTDNNRVAELDIQGRELWSSPAQRPTGAMRLPNGNTLLSSRYSRLIEERGPSGKTVWKMQMEEGNFFCVRYR